MMEREEFTRARAEMVQQIALQVRMLASRLHKETLDRRVLDALASVPRHEFVLPELRAFAYLNEPLPIGYGKTVSQPFIVALMTDLLEVSAGDRVLEVGTGLGYQAAILARLATQVYTLELIAELAEQAEKKLLEQGCVNVVASIGDGSRGWLEHAPFDRIMVTAAPELIPPALIEQLRPGGRMVIPAGLEDAQQLILVERSSSGRVRTREILPVRFSRLTLAH